MKCEQIKPKEHEFQKHEWLGEIPNQWKIQPLKTVTRLVNRGNSPKYVDESSIKVINQACIQWNGLNLENIKFQKDQDVSQWKGLLFPKDLLLNSTGTGTLGRLALFKEQGNFIADGHVTVIRVNHQIIDYRYLYYLLQTPLYQGFIYNTIVSGSTNQIELSRDGLRNLPIIIPGYEEQQAIANYLDRETARIDTLIAKYQRLIELLNEKQVKIVNRAVMKGLDSSKKYTSTTLLWANCIPNNWDIVRNGNLFDERDERNRRDLPLLNVSIHTGVTLREFSTEHVEQVALDWSTYKVARRGDIAFNKMRMWQGAVGVVPEDGLVSPDYTVACPRKNVNPHYFVYLFGTELYKNEINRYSHGIVSDRNRLYWDQFKQLPSLCPPYEEQNEIVEYLDQEIEKDNRLKEKLSVIVGLLQEYRNSIIASSVTGKIDLSNLSKT